MNREHALMYRDMKIEITYNEDVTPCLRGGGTAADNLQVVTGSFFQENKTTDIKREKEKRG